jgi:hypothetical protein
MNRGQFASRSLSCRALPFLQIPVFGQIGDDVNHFMFSTLLHVGKIDSSKDALLLGWGSFPDFTSAN